MRAPQPVGGVRQQRRPHQAEAGRARRLPYSTVGVLQYIGPSLQLICGVLFYHESFGRSRAAGFGLLWAALVLYAAEGLRRARSPSRRTLRA